MIVVNFHVIFFLVFGCFAAKNKLDSPQPRLVVNIGQLTVFCELRSQKKFILCPVYGARTFIWNQTEISSDPSGSEALMVMLEHYS